MHVRSPNEQVKTIHHTHTAPTTAMVPIVINGFVLLPLNTRGANEQNAFVRDAELGAAPKATGEVWAPGDLLYWDAAAVKFTKTVGSNTKCGKAGSAQLTADTTGVVILDSYFTP